jgi:hypothetical protein
MSQAQPQVIPFPAQASTPTPTPVMPAFPVLANTIDRYAVRIPWYGWFALGAFLTYKFLKPRG